MAAEHRQSWTAGPSGRGTLNILWSCVSTLALCVWTAVHPNLTPYSGTRTQYYQRSGMMLLAIVFPEIILSSAWSQYQSARLICAIINKAEPAESVDSTRGKSEMPETPVAVAEVVDESLRRSRSAEPGPRTSSNSPLVRKEEESEAWTMEQGFFAVMGGYAVEAMIPYNDQFHGGKGSLRRIVAVDGVRELARAGLLPPLSQEDIQDRSKADLFAKIIVLSQIIWFGLQVISRLAAGLAVTLLEAHTTVHVCCTIIVYLIWLKKPYNVGAPIVLKGDAVDDLAALFSFCEAKEWGYRTRYKEYEKEREQYWRDRHVRNANNILDHDPPPDPPAHIKATRLLELYTSPENSNYPTPLPNDAALKRIAPAAKRGLLSLPGGGGGAEFQEYDRSVQRTFLRDSSQNFMIRAVWGSWSANVGHEWSIDKAIHLLFNLLYGAGHLAAWASSSFPSDVEQWAWRGASIMLAAVPLWGGLWILWWRAVGSKRKLLFPFRNGDFDIVAGPFFFLIMFVYVLARCYFLAESLASLRSLPPSAYETVQWPSVFPHVS